MGKIKAIIFDMDGVLIDAKEWHYEALNKALGLFGLTIDRFDHLVTFDGLPTRKKLQMLSVEKGLPKGLHNLIFELKQRFTLDIIFHKCFPVFEQEFALQQLKREGYTLAVCSNSIRMTIETMLTRANLLQYLDFFLSNQDIDHPKPDPQMYNKAIARMNLAPEECLILEDNENGIKAARASRAHLLEIKNVSEVNYQNIKNAIRQIEMLK